MVDATVEGRPGWRASYGAGLALALAAFLALALRTSFLIDDAFISFRYARNWAELGLPVYNPGESPPVEGYSNFLWVLALRACFELGARPEVASRVLSVTAGALLVVLVHRFLARELALGPLPTALGTLALATFPPFTFWATGGLETAPFALALFAAFALLVRRGGDRGGRAADLAAGAAGVAAALLRAEGILWALGLPACLLLTRRSDPERRTAPPRRLALYAAVVVVGFGAFLAWRLAVYGEWLPNTVRAKAGLSAAVLGRGLRTVATWLLLFLSPLAAPLALRTRGGERRVAAVTALAILTAFLGYNVAVGGDWMPMFRFLAPATPFLAVALALACAALPRGGALALGSAAIALASLPALGRSIVPEAWLRGLAFRSFRVGYQSELERWRTSVANLERFRWIGKGLAQVAGPGDSIAVGAIGAIGYDSGLVVYDRNGLVDREVAAQPASEEARSAGHDKRVPRAFFLDRNPTIFQALLVDGAVGGPGTPSFARAATELGRWVFGGPEGALEAPLLARTLPEVHALEPRDGIPPGSSLILLRPTEDRAAALAFWRELGFAR